MANTSVKSENPAEIKNTVPGKTSLVNCKYLKNIKHKWKNTFLKMPSSNHY